MRIEAWGNGLGFEVIRRGRPSVSVARPEFSPSLGGKFWAVRKVSDGLMGPITKSAKHDNWMMAVALCDASKPEEQE